MAADLRQDLAEWARLAIRLDDSVVGAEGPIHLRDLMAQHLAGVADGPGFDVATATVLLQGLDALAQTAVQETWSDLIASGVASEEAAGSLDAEDKRFLPFANQFRLIADYEETTRDLRQRRQWAVAVELAQLATNPKRLAPFISAVVRPLLARAWRPRLVYEPFAVNDLREHPTELDRWPPPAVGLAGTHLVWNQAAEELCRVWQAEVSSQGGDLNWITTRLAETAQATASAGTLALQAQETLAYLRVAEAIRLAADGDLAVLAPVLFVPHRSDWPLGHVLDVVILPATAIVGLEHHDAFTTVTELRNQSLLPALGAVRDLQAGEHGAFVVVADYPGGGKPVVGAEGPSAGLALAAALVERLCGLRWLPGVLATAAISPNGHVGVLGGAAGLVKKGRVAALAGFEAVVVAAEGHDGDAICTGARQVGGGFAHKRGIRTVAKLEAIEQESPLEDPYLPYLEQLIKEGDKAVEQLRRREEQKQSTT